MKKYQFAGEDKHYFNIHDGESHFKVAKYGIQPHMEKTIRGLPKFSDGGIKEDDSSQGSSGDPDYGWGPIGYINKDRYQNAASDKSMKQEDYSKMDPKLLEDTVDSMSPEDINPEAQTFVNNLKADRSPAASADAQQGVVPNSVAQGAQPQGQQPSQAPAQQAQAPAGVNPGNMINEYNKSINQQASGMGQIAGGQMQAAADQAKIYGSLASPEQQQQLQDQLKSLQQDRVRLDAENNDLQQKAMNNQIDPGRVWNNASTGNKIAAAIAIMFGAAGTAARGGQNQALGIIQNTIDKDIDAQKADAAKNMNLYRLNLDRYKDNLSAQAATRIQLNSVAQGQLMAAAARAQDPIIQGELNKNLGLLKQQQINDTNALYQQQFKYGILNRLSGQGQNQGQSANQGGPDPASQIRMYQIAGVLSDAQATKAYEELGKANEIEKLRASVNQSDKELQQKHFAGALTPADRATHINTYGGILAKIAEGRFNLDESKMQMGALMTAPGDLGSTIKDKGVSREKFFDAMKSTPTLDGLGIKVPRIKQIQESAPNLGK